MVNLERFKRYILLSWKLWRQLLSPRTETVSGRVINKSDHNRLTLFHLSLMMVVAGGVSYGVMRYLRPLSLEFPVLALIILSIVSAITTLIWLVMVTSAITRENQQGTYDLLSLAPSGKMGASWSITIKTLHQQKLFHWIEIGRRWFTGLVLLLFMSLLTLILLSTILETLIPPSEVVILFFEVMVFSILTYLEHIQSLLQGVLIAMLLPHFIRRSIDAAAAASLAYICLQGILLAVFLIGVLIIQTIFIVNEWQYSSILPQLLLLFAIREMSIYALWKLLSWQLSGELRDLKQI